VRQKINYIAFCILFSLSQFILYTASAQHKMHLGSFPNRPIAFSNPDTIQRKKFLSASGQLMLAELLPFTFDRYIRNVDYARISFATINYNLSPSNWTWDGDDFGTNEFAHPYHGSLFFSSFRTLGYSFWQSIPAAFAGSYLWETAGESEYFSPNDFINTSVGGVILGEMTFRLSNKIVNQHSSGFRRQASEVLSLLINPMNGFRRIVDKKWGRVAKTVIQPDPSHIYCELDIGLRNFNANSSGNNFGWYSHVRLLYNSPFESYRIPFSTISINAEFGNDDSSKLNILSVYGSLAGWNIANHSKVKSTAVLSANYDYIRNEAFYYSAQSVKLNLYSDFQPNKKLSLSTNFGIGLILLAAIPDKYGYRNRQYAYGSGIGINIGYGISYSNRYFLNINYRGGLIKTINGNPSHFFLHGIQGEVRYRIIDGLSVCGEPGYLTLKGHYKYKTELNQVYPYLRFSLRYTF